MLRMLVVLAFVALVSLLPGSRSLASNAYEDIMFRLFPSAARGFAYGERHFNDRDPNLYDFPRAEYFFKKAGLLDPTYPYLQHELARIYFLRGDFGEALTHINLQISKYGDATPNSYYVRALIEGFQGDYTDSAADYRRYIPHDPTNWAARNDLAWVLLKSKEPADALATLDEVLPLWPHNPWLLNTKATALYELRRLTEAHTTVDMAAASVITLTGAEWLVPYPGNDPRTAADGVATIQSAVLQNMHIISGAIRAGKKT